MSWMLHHLHYNNIMTFCLQIFFNSTSTVLYTSIMPLHQTKLQDKLRAISMLQAGYTMEEIGKIYKVTRKTLSTWYMKYTLEKNLERKKRTNKTTLQQNVIKVTEMESCDVPSMDVDFTQQIKTEMKDEVLLSDPLETQPLCSEDQTCSNLPTLEMEPFSAETSWQREICDEIIVKEEPLTLEEGEEAGQFVLENEEVKVTEVKQECSGQNSKQNEDIQLKEMSLLKSKIPSKESGRYFCHRCKELFYDLPEHYLSVHGKIALVCGKETLTIKGNKCVLCQLNFIDLHKLRTHIINMHYKPKGFQSPFCKKKFSYELNLRDHVNICIKNPNKKCKICKQPYSNISQHLIENHNA